MLSLLLSLAFLFLAPSSNAFTIPKATTPSGQSLGLFRRAPSPRTADEWGVWAKNHKDVVTSKYGGTGPNQKRSSGTNLITNQNADSTFFGSLAIGTPPVSYNVILDTGSSDLWVAGAGCTTNCESVATFDSSASTSFTNKSTPFSITYGSGAAAGVLGQDSVQMAGFTVANQIFAVCDKVSSGLVNSPVSGLLGLAFQTIASSGATPFWQTLVQNGAWDSPLMSFQLSRYIDDASAKSLEPGGSFTMGFVNSSLYTGDIDFVDIPAGAESYWILPVTSVSVQGNVITLPTGSSSFSAIDTGTTLVGGPSQAIAEIYAQIPDSAPGTGNFEGYYTYPCNTALNLTMSFGGKNWPISDADFQVTQLTNEQCLGAFFELTTGGSAPAWIVGDTFLKNVYSVFRYDPPSVGFAQLSKEALALNGAPGTAPSATIGSAAAIVSATGLSKSRVSSNNASAARLSSPGLITLAVMGTTVIARTLL
jgi:cathepsin D